MCHLLQYVLCTVNRKAFSIIVWITVKPHHIKFVIRKFVNSFFRACHHLTFTKQSSIIQVVGTVSIIVTSLKQSSSLLYLYIHRMIHILLLFRYMLIPVVLWHITYTKKVPEKRFISPLMPCIEVGVFLLVQDKRSESADSHFQRYDPFFMKKRDYCIQKGWTMATETILYRMYIVSF